MTNPNNAVGTNGAYGGRTSVNALNDNLALYTSRGVISGWGVSPSTGMTVTVGGGAARDAAVAEDPNHNRTTINNISGSPISVTIPAAPATGKRIDLIVAYVNNPPQGSSTSIDNPAACGLVTVSSSVSSYPTTPNDSAIRSAITSDGASGSTAYYVILGKVTIPAGTTNIDSTMVNAVQRAGVGSQNVDYATMPTKSYTTTSDKSGSIASVTATEAGRYLVIGSGSGYNTGGSGSMSITIKVNNSSTNFSQRYGGGTSMRYGICISGLLSLNVSDTVSIYSEPIDGGTAQIRSGFVLTVVKVGE